MTDANKDQAAGGTVRRLSDAVRKVRIAEAERVDAFSDLHDAERARLGLLAEELVAVFSELPDNDYFICRISGGMPPRLWVDPTSHVMIGRDRRTYRFVKDTRLGRIVITETADVSAMADVVTDYVAERVNEIERARDSDVLLARMRDVATPRSAQEGEATSRSEPVREPEQGRRSIPLWLLVGFLFGVPAGAIGMIVYAWYFVAI